MDMGMRLPIFDIKVRAQKSNSFSRISQNELAKEFYGMGFFNPQLADQALTCMEMMDFEAKDMVMQKVSQNGTLYQQLQQMQAQMVQMAAVMQAAGLMSPSQEVGTGPQPGDSPASRDPLARATRDAGGTTADKAKERALRATEV